jgi:hypothetical protein
LGDGAWELGILVKRRIVFAIFEAFLFFFICSVSMYMNIFSKSFYHFVLNISILSHIFIDNCVTQFSIIMANYLR